MNSEPHDPDSDACDACPLSTGRRGFLQQGALAVLGALAMAGLPASLAASVRPLRAIAGRRRDANPSYPIPADDGVQIDHDNDVILVRWKGAIYAFNLSCPHQNTALHWNQGDSQFQCPKHHSKYLPDGTYVSGRATRSMDRFSLTRSGNQVVVDVNAMHKNDVDRTGWNDAVILLSGER